jgi:putative transposase
MARPGRNASEDNILSPERTFFATTKTSMGRRLLQSDRNANLLVEVLRSLIVEQKFKLHDFVIMPDHVHLLLTLNEDMTIEKAMQFIKGRFSHRLSHEFGHKGEVWQRGFSEVQVIGRQNFEKCRAYIAKNPIEAGLIAEGGNYPYCFTSLTEKKAAGMGLQAGAKALAI